MKRKNRIELRLHHSFSPLLEGKQCVVLVGRRTLSLLSEYTLSNNDVNFLFMPNVTKS